MIINLPKLGPVRFKDNLSQEEFQTELNRLSTKYEFELPKTDYGLLGSFTKGVSRGATRMSETFGDVLPALGASALGFDDYAKRQMGEAAATEAQLARENPAQFDSYKQVKGVGDAAKYALETLGEVTPDILGMIASGGVGSTIAKKGATKLAEKELASITPGLLESGSSQAELAQVASRVGAESLAKKQAQGQGVGVYLGSFAMNTPEVFQSIYQDSGQLAPGAALLFGSVSSALDSVLPASVLRTLTAPEKAAITGKILEQSGMRPGLVKNITKSAFKSAGIEGLTEGAQEAINIAAEGFVNENREMWTNKDFNRIVESSVRGAVAGSTFGGAQGAVESSRAKSAEEQAQQQQQQQQLDTINAERQRQAGIASQAQADLAAQQQAAQQRSRANLPMDLPGFEAPVGPTMPEATAAEPNLPAGQVVEPALQPQTESLFGATGRPTPEATASVKLAAQQQAQAEKDAKQAEKDADAAQKAAIEELAPKSFDIMQNVRMQGSGLSVTSPLQDLINQATNFGPKVKSPTKVKQEATAEEVATEEVNPNLTSDQTWKDLGVGHSATFRKNGILNNLDITKQEDVDKIHQVLGAYLESPKLSGKLAESVDKFKQGLPAPTAPVSKEVIKPTEKPVEKEEAVTEEVITGNKPLSADKVMETTEAPLTKEEVPSLVAGFISQQVRDSVTTDLDNEGVAKGATGRRELEQVEASNIQKNINKKALLNNVVEPLRAVNLLREVLDLQAIAKGEKPDTTRDARIAELEKVIAGFGPDLQNVYEQFKTATKEQRNNFFDGVNTQARETLADLITEAREKVYPKSKTKRVLIPEDSDKSNVSELVDKRKRELGIKETKDVTFAEAADKLKAEIDKFIGKAGRAYMVEETPPEILKALTQLIEVMVRDGIRSLKDATARIRSEFGENVFRTVAKKDIAKLFNEQMKASKVDSVKEQEKKAKATIDAPAEVYESLPEGSPKVYDAALNAYSNTSDTVQKRMLDLWGINDLIDVFGKKFPSLKNMLVALERRASVNDSYRDKVAKIVNDGSKLLNTLSPEETKRFNETVLEVSRLNLDPRKATDANYPAVKRFMALPEVQRNYAIKLVEQYEAYSKEYLDLLVNQIPQKNNREYLTNVEKMRNEFETKRIPFYFPLLRSGDYWVSYKDTNGERVVFARESKREAEKLVQDIQKAGGKEISQYTKLDQINFNTAPPTGFIANVISNLKDAKVSDEVINGVYRSYLDLFPAQSLKQQFQNRKGDLGYDTDIVQGFAQVGSRMAQQLANMQFAPDIGNAIKDMQVVYEKDSSMENRNILDTVMKRERFLLNPVAEPWASALSHLSYAQYILGNVSSAVVNISQLPIVVYSLLGGKYGWGNASSAMITAFKMYSKGGWDNNAEFMPDWTFGANAKGEYAELYKQALDRSAIRRGVGYELTEARKAKVSDYSGKVAKAEHFLGYLFQNSERFNREITLIAAYDLARKAGKTQQEAIEDALKINIDAHSHALSEAGPALFQQGWGKVAFTFKRFAQAQIALLMKLATKAYKGEDAETRRIARRQITGVFGMAYLFAGVQGMPLYGAANLVASAVNAALGDDDEPFDADESVRSAIGDLGYKGPINQLLNVDIASRTGFNGMIWRDDPRRLAEVGPLQYAVERFAGPAFSIGVNYQRAISQMNKGQTERAIETAMPSFIKNGMKGIRYASEGALNSKGVPIVDDVSTYNAFMQVLGFTPADLSEAYARAGSMKAAEKYITDRRHALLDGMYLAKNNGDSDDVADIQEKIYNFNAIHPEPGIRIDASTIKKSEAGRDQAMKESVDGVRITPKLKHYIVDNYGS
jgi:hypothetical protein